VATVILLVNLGYERRWAVWLLPLYLGLVFATVYGRFHYAVDVLAGWALALAIVGWHRFDSKQSGSLDSLDDGGDAHSASDTEGDDRRLQVAAL
jgi:hypothetical protein